MCKRYIFCIIRALLVNLTQSKIIGILNLFAWLPLGKVHVPFPPVSTPLQGSMRCCWLTPTNLTLITNHAMFSSTSMPFHVSLSRLFPHLLLAIFGRPNLSILISFWKEMTLSIPFGFQSEVHSKTNAMIWISLVMNLTMIMLFIKECDATQYFCSYCFTHN